MNGFFLLLPFFLIRFFLLYFKNPKALLRAAHFAPMRGMEKIAYYAYQLSNIAFFAALLFHTVLIDFSWKFYLGAILYIAGLCLCAITVINFSTPDRGELNTNGIYKFSRNPMYVSYFVCFLGMVLLTQSLILLGILLLFQVSSHWIILTEERWCMEKFGNDYRQYKEKVRRYF